MSYLLIVGGIFMTAAIASVPVPAAVLAADDVRSQFDAILQEVPQEHFFAPAQMRKLLEKYSAAELQLILKDFCELRVQTFGKAAKKLDYVVTAGGPSAGKSTLLESLLTKEYAEHAYIDPDRSCMQRMAHTYKADLESRKRTPQQAYEHWRDASNFCSNVFLAIALDQGYAIAHGSTMATPHAKNALDSIRNWYSYRTTVVHVTCDEEVRKASEELRRKGGVVQCTDQDFKEKQAMFLTLLPVYPAHADRVIFHYRGTYDQSTQAATLEKGTLTIHNEAAFIHIQKIHDAAQGQGFSKKALTGEPKEEKKQ